MKNLVGGKHAQAAGVTKRIAKQSSLKHLEEDSEGVDCSRNRCIKIHHTWTLCPEPATTVTFLVLTNPEPQTLEHKKIHFVFHVEICIVGHMVLAWLPPTAQNKATLLNRLL
ncbi:hypothetical protein AMECASPLE_011083 [Ameca splendens]|uniref:Uncharacterized protein n=1 Tax=Ameca splendens TaxID=208324 RepID=A0ABV1A703_9TELE